MRGLTSPLPVPDKIFKKKKKALAAKTGWPEFDPWNLPGRRRNQHLQIVIRLPDENLCLVPGTDKVEKGKQLLYVVL